MTAWQAAVANAVCCNCKSGQLGTGTPGDSQVVGAPHAKATAGARVIGMSCMQLQVNARTPDMLVGGERYFARQFQGRGLVPREILKEGIRVREALVPYMLLK